MIALLLACCLSAPAEVTVDTEKITLGAIVEFPAGDQRASLSLGSAPQPGLGRSFSKLELIAKVTTAGLPAGDLQLPDSVLVRRKSQGLDSATVNGLVREAFARQFPDADITVVSVEIPDVALATGPLEFNAALPERPDPAQPIFVILDVRSAGFARRVFVKTIAEVRKPQPTLREGLGSNAEIRREDVEWKVMPVRGRSETLQPTSSLDGMLTKRAIAAGEVLTSDLFYSPLLVHKGESVTVRASNGGITVTAVMRAKASAHLGETVAVEHLTGGGSTTARVVGTRQLEATQGAK